MQRNILLVACGRGRVVSVTAGRERTCSVTAGRERTCNVTAGRFSVKQEPNPDASRPDSNVGHVQMALFAFIICLFVSMVSVPCP